MSTAATSRQHTGTAAAEGVLGARDFLKKIEWIKGIIADGAEQENATQTI